MLCVRMLGVLTFSIGGHRIAHDLGPNGRIFSGFLLQFNGRVHRRERLLEQFWSQLEPHRARAALNTALWRLRKLLARDSQSDGGRNLHSNGYDIILEPAKWLDIDTMHFGETVKRLLEQPGAVDDESSLSQLERAAGLYSGPFLEGLEADWLLEERERLHSLYIRTLTELLRRYGQIERYEEAIAAARTILGADPFRESIHRDLLVLLVLNSQRGEALRQHTRWSERLRDELGVGPMPQTARIAQEIQTGAIFDRMEGLKKEYFSPIKPSTQACPGGGLLALKSAQSRILPYQESTQKTSHRK